VARAQRKAFDSIVTLVVLTIWLEQNDRCIVIRSLLLP
jgi:hypothetical protein